VFVIIDTNGLSLLLLEYLSYFFRGGQMSEAAVRG
jgi:hypothetical protein